jgi:hypothetical protein
MMFGQNRSDMCQEHIPDNQRLLFIKETPNEQSQKLSQSHGFSKTESLTTFSTSRKFAWSHIMTLMQWISISKLHPPFMVEIMTRYEYHIG